MLKKRLKNGVIGVLIILCILVLPAFIPVKISLDSVEQVKSDTYFIVQMTSIGSTDGGLWICIGDENHPKLEEIGYAVELYGAIPADTLSADVYDSFETKFIIYGTVDGGEMEEHKVNHIHCTGWTILGDIIRNPDTLRLPLKRYVSVYDLKYFDFLFRYEGL